MLQWANFVCRRTGTIQIVDGVLFRTQLQSIATGPPSLGTLIYSMHCIIQFSHRVEIVRSKEQLMLDICLPLILSQNCRLCLVTYLVFYFLKFVFRNIKKKKQFSCIFETKNMFCQLKFKKKKFFEEKNKKKILKYAVIRI